MARKKSSAPSGKASDTALRNSAFFQLKVKRRGLSEVKDDFRKQNDVRWQPSGARSNAKGSAQGERGGDHQFVVSPKGNGNFTWVQHFIPHPAPHGMAALVLTNGSISSNQSDIGEIAGWSTF